MRNGEQNTMRAFLSHKSTDKAFVQEVANYLGRSRVVFDVFEFSTGDEFHEAIRKGIDRSDIFVLFASRDALESEWVQFETNVAEEAISARALSKAACYIIDDTLSVDDLPLWLRHTLATRQTSPRLVALDIRRLINESIASRRPRFYVGRNDKMEEALDAIASDSNPLIV